MSTTEQSTTDTGTTSSSVRLYVACLAAYNNGILHGRWIDATRGEDHVRDEIDKMLKASPIPYAEEYAIHDYEGFEGAHIEEYSGITEVCALAAFIAEHGALGGKLVAHFGDLESALVAIEDNYAGEYRSLADFAQEITKETTTIPENLQYYIDWERMGRDLEVNDVLAIETGFDEVHIFWQQ